jgi:PKD repeat protein
VSRRRSRARLRGHVQRVSVLVVLCATVLVAALSATPAGAVVARIGGRNYGFTPVRGINPASLPAVKRALGSSATATTGPQPYDSVGQLTYHGGPVMHSVTTHVIYWDPIGEFTPTTKGIVNKFFTDVAHDKGLGTNVFAVAGEYKDGGGNSLYSSSFETEETDKTAFPTSGCTVPSAFDTGPPYTHCITDEQLRSELSAYVAAHSLPKGPTQQYFVLFPHKVVTCLEAGVCSNNFYCAYHSSISGGTSNEVIYSDIPFSLLDSGDAKACQFDENAEIQHPNGDTTGTDATTRYADVALKVTSHEYIESSTDPLGTAWFDTKGQEIGDKCNTTGSKEGEDPNAFLPELGGTAASGTLFNQAINGDQFYLQSEWDNVAKACQMTPVALTGATATPSQTSGLVGAAVKFNGAATDPYGGARFVWKFGDGTEAGGASAEHVYGAPGSYEVTMTATDEFTGATVAPVVQTFVVDEPPAAAFTSAPSGAVAGAAVAFDGSGSSDQDGAIIGYAWSFGDGATGSGATISHAYASAGSYTVTLTVTDSNGHSATATHSVTIAAAQTVATSTIAPPVIPPASSAFTSGATFNAASGVATATVTVAQPGTFKWLLTFQNGKFGVFAASASKCKKGFVRLGGKCRPAKVVFARGSMSVATPGAVKLAIKPTAAGLKALRNALKHKQGVPVTMTLTFQSSRGGSAVTHTRTVLVKLKKR